MSSRTSLGLAILPFATFGTDPTIHENSFIAGLTRHCKENEECEIIAVPPNEISYGVSSGKAWLSILERKMSFDSAMPQWCICRAAGDVAHHIEQMGIPCFPTPTNTEFFKSKRKTAAFASKIGVPCIDTASGFDGWAVADMDYPLIVKPAHGHKGQNIRKVATDMQRRAAESCVELDEPGGVVWQECMPTGNDLRLYMMGTEPYGAILRRASGLKANLAHAHQTEIYPNAGSVEKAFPEACEIARIVFSSAPYGEMGLGSADFLFADDEGDKNAVLGEVTVGSIGTVLLNAHFPEYVEDYIRYIEKRLFE